MTPELILLIGSMVKSAIQEGLFWSKGKSREEILARVETEETKTRDLIARMNAPDPPDDSESSTPPAE